MGIRPLLSIIQIFLVVILTAPEVAMASRFMDNGDGTITDTGSGLVWLKNAGCQGYDRPAYDAYAWTSSIANGLCGLTDGSKAGDWTVPEFLEMASLISGATGVKAQWLNSQGFINISGSGASSYWAGPYDYTHFPCNTVDMSTTGETIEGCMWFETLFEPYFWAATLPIRKGKPSTKLTLNKNGRGEGNVTADSGTITWVGSTAEVSYPSGTSVTLTPSAESGSFFSGWTGCDSQLFDTCTVNMTTLKNVTATFEPRNYGNVGLASTLTLYQTQGGVPNNSEVGSNHGDNEFAGTSEIGYRTSGEDQQLISHALYPVEFFTQKSSDGFGYIKRTAGISEVEGPDNRQPLVLIHGWQGDSGISFIDRDQKWLLEDAQLGETYWTNFIQYFNKTPELKNRYRLYVYHYPSYKHIPFNARMLAKLIPKVDYINNWLANGKQVTILAHSMGGLVARSLIEERDGVSVTMGDGSTLRVSGLTMLDRLVTTATPHHGSPAAIYWWLKKDLGPVQLTDFVKDIFSPGAQDLFWDNYDGVFDWVLQNPYTYYESGEDTNRIDYYNSGRRTENDAFEDSFDNYYRAELSALESKANEAYDMSKLRIQTSDIPTVTKVYRYPNPWLSLLNKKYHQNIAAYKYKYFFYGGYNDGNNDSSANMLYDGFGEVSAGDLVDKRIFDMGYINDWVVPLTSAFLDFSKEYDGSLNTNNPNLFTDAGGKSALFNDWLLDNSFVVYLNQYNGIPVRAFKDYKHDRMLNGAYFSDAADLMLPLTESGFRTNADAQLYLNQASVNLSQSLLVGEPLLPNSNLGPDAKLIYEPLYNLFKLDLTRYIVAVNSSANGTITPDTLLFGGVNGAGTYTITPNSGYLIGAVTGCNGTLTGDKYTVSTLTGNCVITATYTLAKVKVGAIAFSTLQDAYASANNNDIFLIQAHSFVEDLNLNRAINIKLGGGKDEGYSSTVGVTTIQGVLTISQGSVEISDVVIM